MKSWIKCMVGALAVVFFWATIGGAAEVLKFGHVSESTHPLHQRAVWAAQEIEKRTEGRYKIEVFPASALGKQADLDEALSMGAVDFSYPSVAFAANAYPPIGIAAAPYMFRDMDHWKKFSNSDVFEKLAQGFYESTGNVILANPFYGFRHVTSNKPIKTPEDMQGLKIRVPNAPLYKMFPDTVGANSTPIAFAEVYLALQQGVVDAQENPLAVIKSKKFYEVQEYINLTGHMMDSIFTVMSGVTWNRLSPEDKAVFKAVFREAANGVTQDVLSAEDALAAELNDPPETTVLKVDRSLFRNATVKAHTAKGVAWSSEIYDAVQAIQ